MIGRLRTVVLDAADMDSEASFWSQVLGIPVLRQAEMEAETRRALEAGGTRIPSLRTAVEHLSGSVHKYSSARPYRRASILASPAGAGWAHEHPHHPPRPLHHQKRLRRHHNWKPRSLRRR